MNKKSHVHVSLHACLSLALCSGAAYAQVPPEEKIRMEKIEYVESVEEIVVRAQRQNGMLDDLKREYRSIDGKRIFDGPYGDIGFILAIGQELRNRGEMKKIMSRRINMPADFPGSSLNRYQYPVADECGIEKFQLFDGGQFMALGYEVMTNRGTSEVIFDVLMGGGPFAAPSLWGPYDQIIGRRHGMQMIMGDAAKDGMGLMKSGYAVGMKADLSNAEYNEVGDIYSNAINKTGQCLADKGDIKAAKDFLSRN
jgi:hypothetical protein